LVSVRGIRGQAERVTDGEWPADETAWDSPASVVLTSSESYIEVSVPRTPADGVFLSVDSGDTYVVDCFDSAGRLWPLGSVVAGDTVGTGTGLLLSDRLSSCESIKVHATGGDGYYSVAEVGFFRR
jgi:hypothetical protein